MGWSAALAVMVVGAGLAFWAAGRPSTVDAPYVAYLAQARGPQQVAFTGPNPGIGTVSEAVQSPAGLTGVPNPLLAEQVRLAAAQAGMSAGVEVVQRTMLATTRAGGSAALMGVALRLPQGLARVGYWFSGGGVTWYEPPFIELPADPQPGASWTSEGALFGRYPYRFDGRIEAEGSAAGCVRVVSTLRQQNAQGSWTTLEDAATWCQGRGLVRSESFDTGEVMELLERGAAVLLPAGSAPQGGAWPANAVLEIPAVTLLVQPAALLAGTLVVADAVSHDLVAVRLDAPPAQPAEPLAALEARWIQHPGGSILGLASDGDRVVAATSTRMLMAFDVEGQLLWSSPMGDAASGPPAFAGGMVLVPTMDAAIEAYGRDDGRLAWVYRMPEVVDAPLATISGERTADDRIADDRVIVSDLAGNLRLLGSDGSVLWSIDDAAPASTVTALADGAVLLANPDGGLALISTPSDEPGSERGPGLVRLSWQQDLQGAITGSAILVGDLVIVPTKDALTGLDRATGLLRWTRPELADARVVESSGRLLGISGSVMFEVDSAGDILAAEPFLSDDLTLRRLMPMAADGGMLVVSDDGRVRTWAGVDG